MADPWSRLFFISSITFLPTSSTPCPSHLLSKMTTSDQTNFIPFLYINAKASNLGCRWSCLKENINRTATLLCHCLQPKSLYLQSAIFPYFPRLFSLLFSTATTSRLFHLPKPLRITPLIIDNYLPRMRGKIHQTGYFSCTQIFFIFCHNVVHLDMPVSLTEFHQLTAPVPISSPPSFN